MIKLILFIIIQHIKFGIGRATYDAAQEIRNDKITRDEGVSLVKNMIMSFQKNTSVIFLIISTLMRKIF